jgi:HlyD family secretion protein
MKKVLLVVGIIAVIGAASFLTYRVLAARQSASQVGTANVQTTTVVRGSIPATISTAGTVRSGQTATISWQTSGKVDEVNVKLGDQVQAKQQLASLDPASLSPAMIGAVQTLIDAKKSLANLQGSSLSQAQAEQAVTTAQTTLTNAQATRAGLNGTTAASQAVINQAYANYLLSQSRVEQLQKHYDNMASLNDQNLRKAQALSALSAAQQKRDSDLAAYNADKAAPSSQDIATSDAAVAVAQATLVDAQHQLELIKNGSVTDDIKAAQAAVDAAQATLNQQFLAAPFAGTISSVNVQVGDLVASGTNAFQIDALSTLFVDLPVAEVDITNVKVGQPATLTFDAISGKTYNGNVTQIGLVGTSTQGVVNYPVTVQITDADEMVKPGMTAAVSIVVDQHDNVLLVPNQSIQVTGSRRQVVVLFEGQEIPVPVTVGLTNSTMSEVTGNQLKEGDTILLNPPAATTTNGARGGFFGGGGFGGGFARPGG